MKGYANRRLVQGLGMCLALAMIFYGAAGVIYGAWELWYLALNLLLGSVALLLTYPLLQSASRQGWSHPLTWLWTAVWLGFLPNSFYVLTDFVHLLETSYGMEALFGIVLFSLFAFVGMAMGFVSLYIVHQAFLERLGGAAAYVVAQVILLLSSVAIYLGRTLRWNTWDILLNPIAIGNDVASGLLQPVPLAVMTTTVFFVLLSGLYAAFWWAWGSRSSAQ